MSLRNIYSIDTLNDAMIRDNAKLLNTYEKISKRTRIHFMCNCGEIHSKLCLEVVSRAGAFCKKCTKINYIKKLQNTLEKKGEILCNINKLNEIITRDNATLMVNYDVITSNTLIRFKCNCGEEYEKNSTQLIRVSGAFCKKCTREKWNYNTKKTNIDRYGVSCTIHASHIKERIKINNIKKWGVEYPSTLEAIKQKIKQTTLEKYGVEHIMYSDTVKQNIKNRNLEKYGVENIFQYDIFKQKQKQTMINKYGVEHVSQLNDFKQKVKETYIKKYGVEHPFQAEEIKQKRKQTYINKYGVDNPNKTPEVREKIKKTCLKKYGVEYPSQSIEILEKQQKNSKKYKDYTMPSGICRKVQGYEPFALDELIKMYEENDIITNRKDIPKICYKIDDKEKYYFPDIYIKSKNKIIEVKSYWTYKCKYDNIQIKANATKMAGYEYEIWIYDDKGNKIIV
jgi:hypothetical protein